jgi:hypothetical protein
MPNRKLIQQLAMDAGIVLPQGTQFYEDGWKRNYQLAMDAQPALVTVSSAGIPAYLANFIDPNVIEVLTAPMKAAVILGEAQKGDWVTATATFPVIEYTGETSSYGDYNENGSVGANANFPQRQSYHYQTMTQWGEKELAEAGLAKLDWVSRLNIASVLILNKYQNLSYFFGVSGLQNYGLLNDPLLPAAITPATKIAGGVLWSAATAGEVYQDVLNLFKQLQTQSGGLLTMDSPMVMALSPTAAVNLNKVSAFNVNARTTIKENFPNLRIETAPEYSTVSGELVQMIVESLEGQKTATTAFTEKLRAHPVIMLTSSFKQKKSQGTWGTIIYRPFLVGQMLGV